MSDAAKPSGHGPVSKSEPLLSQADRSAFLHHMREPVFTFLALLGFLAINVATGWLQPFPHVWVLNLAVMVLMIATVLLFSMEVIQDEALIRLFSVIGFCWVAILFTMTLIDYFTRDATY